MLKTTFIILIVSVIFFSSCEKEYTCVCTSRISGEKKPGDKVKTTHLGKKGFEKSCKSNSNDIQDCYVESCRLFER
jgi:hypothetical protein